MSKRQGVIPRVLLVVQERFQQCVFAILMAIAFLTPEALWAQSIDQVQEVGLRIRAAQTLGALGTSLFGDSVNYYDGDTTFSVVDIDLPGNNALPVRLGRVLHAQFMDQTPGLFGSWQIDLPYIGGLFAHSLGWVTNSSTSPYARCSLGSYPKTILYQHSVGYWKYWFGNQIHIPGRGTHALLTNYAGPVASDGQTTYWGTLDFTQIRCLSSIANPSSATSYSGEGFLAITADGTKYYFDWMTSQAAYALTHPGDTSGTETLARDEYRLYPTRVEDRFGNWVTYIWTGNRLTQIISSDGRKITIAYDSYGHVASATANGRTWTFDIEQATNGYLHGVTLPDGSNWTIDTTLLNVAYYSVGKLQCYEKAPLIDTTRVFTFKHPSGAIGEFTLAPMRHERTRIPLACSTSPGDTTKEQKPQIYRDTFSLTQKKIYGPGLPTLTWGLSYNAVNTDVSVHSAACTTCAPDTTWIRVTNPDLTVSQYTFGLRYYIDEGKLLREDAYAGNGALIRSTSFEYATSPAAPAYPYHVGDLGINGNTGGDAFADTYLVPRTQTTVSENGDSYYETIDSFDAKARALGVVRSNTLGNTRSDTAAYADDLNHWVLNQIGSRTNGNTGLTEASADYDSLARPIRAYTFGSLQKSATYNSDGTLATLADGLSRTTSYSNWKRGTPQTLIRPDATTQSAVVNDSGWITSVTDERSSTMGYGYDAMGRIAGITYPTGDTVSWTSESIGYTVLASSELGVPSGAWRRRHTQGRRQISTYYDSLWRPILVEDKDTTTGAAIYAKTAYDHEGRVTFASYPSASYTATAGITSTYDVLGRLTQRQTTDGVTLEQIAYLSGNRKQLTDADGKVTTITYQAFDEPDYSKPTLIQSPENQTTTINRDVFGKITGVTQSGSWSGGSVSATRSFTYDSYQRPCRRIDPESGSTIWGYDAASQVVWELKGTTGSGCVTTQPSGATVFGYDDLGRKTLDDEPGTADDVSYGYDAAGNLTSVTNPTATWTYTYNKRNLLETEQAVIDGKTFVLNPTYNALAQISQLTTPGQTISYAPDAFGRPTQLGSFATGINYYPNDLPQSYSLASGLGYSQSLDNRQRPQLQTTLDGSAVIQQYQYTYSDAGDLLSLTDQSDGDNSGPDGLMLGYDNLHRLKTATGLWGTYGYVYDPLNNLRSRTGPNALTYSYNATTNRLSGISGSQSRTYGYNSKGEITGNGTKSFTLNAKGQISSITGIAAYGYDGNGKRIKTVKGSTTEYALYDQAGHLVYTEAGTTKTDYLSLNGQTLVELKKVGSTTTPTYLHPDLLGSPRKATDAAGTILWDEHYDPYGQKLNGVSEKIGYTGHAFDPESNLTYMEARFFDPLTGRFLSIDPVYFTDESPFTFNRYSYANNNPYRHADPTGESPIGIAFLVVDGVKLGAAIASGNPAAIQSAAVDAGLSALGVLSPVPGTGQALKAVRAADKAAEIYRGSKLARNMANEGRGVIKGEEQAHHVVAKNAEAAAPAREILERHGIGVDDAVNGAAMKTQAHQTMHTREYYRDVNRQVQSADQAGGKQAVIEKLCELCNKLENR